MTHNFDEVDNYRQQIPTDEVRSRYIRMLRTLGVSAKERQRFAGGLIVYIQVTPTASSELFSKAGLVYLLGGKSERVTESKSEQAIFFKTNSKGEPVEDGIVLNVPVFSLAKHLDISEKKLAKKDVQADSGHTFPDLGGLIRAIFSASSPSVQKSFKEKYGSPLPPKDSQEIA